MADQKPNDPVRIDKGMTLDLLVDTGPSRSATSDMPVIETKPDVTVAKTEAKPDSAPAPVEAEAEHEDDTEASEVVEDAAEVKPADAAAQPEPKKARGVQKRIDELVKQREEERSEKLRLLAMLEARERPEQPVAQPVVEEEAEPVMPTRSAYTDPDTYAEALATWAKQSASWAGKREARAMIESERARVQEDNLAAAKFQVQQAYKARVEKVVTKYPDYHEVAESPDVMVSPVMAHAIVNSEDGPELQYFLGKNPAEAARILNLNPALQLVEMGELSFRLSAPAPAAAAAPAAAPAAKPVSAAPKPIKPLASGGEASVPSDQEESMDAYAARRKKELAAENRPGRRLN